MNSTTLGTNPATEAEDDIIKSSEGNEVAMIEAIMRLITKVLTIEEGRDLMSGK